MTVANSGSVQIEKNGKTYEATYRVWKGVITVEYGEESKSTQVGGLSSGAAAKLLLTEILNKE